jgi:hypothetical protein
VPWADAERRRRRLSRLYVQLFTLQQQLAGSLVEAPVELVWGFGLGVVNRPETPLAYPLITRLVDLTLNAGTGAVEVRPRDVDPSLELDFYANLEKPAGERSAVAPPSRPADAGACRRRITPFDRRARAGAGGAMPHVRRRRPPPSSLAPPEPAEACRR